MHIPSISFLGNYTIIHALDIKRIEEESSQGKNKKLLGKLKTGAVVGIQGFAQAFVTGMVLSFLAGQIFDNTNGVRFFDNRGVIQRPNLIGIVILSPIIEEFLYRFFLQNGIWLSQEFAKKQMPSTHRVFKWLTSPSIRIVAVNFIFASTHIRNMGRYTSTADTIAHIITIFLLPRYSIVYETTSSIWSSLFCHMINNFVSGVISGIEVKIQ